MKKTGDLLINNWVKYNKHSILFNDIHGNLIVYNLKNNYLFNWKHSLSNYIWFENKSFLRKYIQTTSFDSTIKN